VGRCSEVSQAKPRPPDRYETSAAVFQREGEEDFELMVLRGLVRPDLLRQERLPDILTATARRRPGHPALLWREGVVTYGELDVASNVFARELMRRGSAPGRIIGLFLPRCADLLIAQAGISKSGAAWLPFDADTPRERVKACLQSAGAWGLVTCRDWLTSLQSLPIPVWAVEDLLTQGALLGPEGQPLGGARPSDPAYVIFTSGSTGQPKGIMVSHRSICHFVRSENELLGVRAEDRVYQGFSVAFDMSFEEIWIAYLVGATLWVAPAESVGDPDHLARAAARHCLTVLHAVPTLMGLIDDPLPSVRLINVGGEPCPEALVGRLARPGRELFNTYGPTETTVSATLARLAPGRPVTIGMPLPNYGLMVLDEQRQPLPAGEVGELGIFGPGVAMGYLGRPELTADRFVANPQAATSDEARLYLTGDLGRIESGGPVHYLGRGDGQVKVRGFRVELGEIEVALADQPGVVAAAVVVRPTAAADELVGFVVPGADADGQLGPAVLRRALGARLPSYMVPQHFEIVSQLPRLVSGKVDRKALGVLPLTTVESFAHDASVPPRNQDEAALYSALKELFPAAVLGPEADFFDDLGGHSLLVARLVSRIRSNPDFAEMSIQDVYRQRRLGAIATTMRRRRLRNRRSVALARAVVPKWRRLSCGLAQAVAVPFLMIFHIAFWLAPFFVYHYFTGDETDSIALAALYSVATFLAVEVATFGVAIVGKWLVAGRMKAGRYPLWGLTYFRWWLSDRLCKLPPVNLLTGTPLLVWYLRALGARIGRDVQIDSLDLQAPDLLTVESGASIGMAVHIANARAERGELVLGPVCIGRDALVESCAVLEDNTSVGADACLGGLSALAAGCHVREGETWEGSPARPVQRTVAELPPRPQFSRMARLAQVSFFIVAGLAVATLFFMTIFPCFMLIDWADVQLWNLSENKAYPFFAFGLFFLLGIPASMALVLVTILLAAGLRLVVGRQRPGRSAVYGPGYCRKWLLSRIYESSLEVLQGLYASVFAPSWLRLMGARVGPGAEVSTAMGVIPDLLSLGEHSFIADRVLLGDEEQRGGWMVLHPTAIGDRSFLGNGAYVSNGAVVPEDVLIGVETRTPDNEQLRSGQTWMGSPALLLPARECLTGFDEALTFRPSWQRRIGRGVVEALRIVLPLAFIIASGYLIIQVVMPIAEQDRWFETAAALALAGCLFGLASFLLVVGLKWTLVGRYRARAAPMWSLFVWLSEAVTNLYESLAVPNFLEFLRGTPLLPWALRLLGARLGTGIYLDTTDLTEFDCVRIGNEAELNACSGPQTHLFEDRVMKIGQVEIGAQVTVGPSSTILYESCIGDGTQLGPLTLVAKGERIPAGTRWTGSPAVPVVVEDEPIHEVATRRDVGGDRAARLRPSDSSEFAIPG
jgi:non-ribosomal peptide synthetase-like protein